MTVTQDKIDEIWAGDLLDRKADAQFLVDFLPARAMERALDETPHAYVLNIDAEWGLGKTFFLTRLQTQLIEEGYVAARVDAWRDDHATDPLLPVISAIDQAIGVAAPKGKVPDDVKELVAAVARGAGRIAWAFGKGVIFSAAKRYVGQEFTDELSGLLKDKGAKSGKTGENLEAVVSAGVERAFDKADAVVEELAARALDEFQAAQGMVDTFRRQIENLTNEFGAIGRKAPLFVLIDELDRCRPTYAIELLERVKHLFSVPNVVFVVATDTEQLTHSIRAIYGSGFDSRKYLTRFFDRSYKFETLEPAELIHYLVGATPLDEAKIQAPLGLNVAQYLIMGSKRLDLDLRAIRQTYDMIRTTVTAWKVAVPLQLGLLFPLIVAHHRGLSLDAPDLIKNVFDAENFVGFDPTVKYWGAEGKAATTNLAAIAQRLWSLRDADIGKHFGSSREQYGPGGWASDVLGTELQILHNNRLSRETPTPSVIKRYAAIVRSAGRFGDA